MKKTTPKVVAVKNTFDLSRALIAVDNKSALNKQRTQVKATIKAFDKASGATLSACQMLFENVAHCMDGEFQEKAFKLAKKNWHALAGFKNAETLKNETGINLSPYWSILAWGAKQPIAYYTFNELRTAYDSKPKNKVESNAKKASNTGTESEQVEDADTDNLAPNAHPMLLELFNKLSQLPQDQQMVVAEQLRADSVKIILRLQKAIDADSKKQLKVA